MSDNKPAPQVTGWLKKKADKGLKVGPLSKVAWNNRWFALDAIDKKLYYYELQTSEAPKGVIDLSKITKIEKTGKADGEFQIDVVEDSKPGNPVRPYLLQASSVAQMDLWIKAVNVVKSTIKTKPKATASATANPTNAAPNSEQSSDLSPKLPTSAPNQTINNPPTIPTNAIAPLQSEILSVSPSLKDGRTNHGLESNFSSSVPNELPNHVRNSIGNSTDTLDTKSIHSTSADPESQNSKQELPQTSQTSAVKNTSNPTNANTSIAKQTSSPNGSPAKASPRLRVHERPQTSYFGSSPLPLTSDSTGSPKASASSPKVSAIASTNGGTKNTTSSNQPHPNFHRTHSSSQPDSKPSTNASSSSNTSSLIKPNAGQKGRDPALNSPPTNSSVPSPDTNQRTMAPSIPSKEVEDIISIGNENVELKSSLSSLAKRNLGESLLHDVPLNSSADEIQVGDKDGGNIASVNSSLNDNNPISNQATVATDEQFDSLMKTLDINIPGEDLRINSIDNNNNTINSSPSTPKKESLTTNLGTGRRAGGPAVPSPAALLAHKLKTSSEEINSIPSNYAELMQQEASRHERMQSASQNSIDLSNAILVTSPEQLIAALKNARETHASEPNHETLIHLEPFTLLGVNGVWIVKSRSGRLGRNEMEPNFLDEYNPESSYTWTLPGFITIRWYGHEKWSVLSREVAPHDEIKWELAAIGRKLQSPSFQHISKPRQALIYHLYSCVHKIIMPFTTLFNSYEIPEEQKSSCFDDSLDENEKLGNLVHYEFLPRIIAILFDGFHDWSLFKSYHVWDFIFEAATNRTSAPDLSALQLASSVKFIESDASLPSPKDKLNAFLLDSLNFRMTHAWLRLLLHNQVEVQDYFDDDSLVRRYPVIITDAIAPLTAIPFKLSRQFEKRHLPPPSQNQHPSPSIFSTPSPSNPILLSSTDSNTINSRSTNRASFLPEVVGEQPNPSNRTNSTSPEESSITGKVANAITGWFS